MVAAVVYAGAGPVARALESLSLSGLLILMLAHLPIAAVMGGAWWLAAGRAPAASCVRFMWGRLVRDAAAETLPFLQFGGVLLGVRALGPGRTTAVRGAVAASVDGVVELAAKLPYVVAATLALLALAPHSRLERPLLLALLASVALVAIPLVARRSLAALAERMVRAVSRRLPAMLRLDEQLIGGEVRDSFADILEQRARLWSAFVLHLLCWYLGAVEMWITFRLLGQDVTLLKALAMDGVVATLRMFGLLVPAAAGVQEASYLVAAAVLGIAPATAIAAALARRARDLALGVVTLAFAVVGDAGFAVLTLAGLLGLGGTPRAHAPAADVQETQAARTAGPATTLTD
jgi:hypothetical protein